MKTLPRRLTWGALSLALALPALAPAAQAQASQLPLERIFASRDFRPEGLPALQWMADGERFTFVEHDASGATDLVAEDARTGRRTVIVEGERLLPAGATRPLQIEDYQFSADERKVLLFTDAQPVWRQRTKGRFYLWDLDASRLTAVSTAPGWQQFAKLSPDGTRVGFVRDNDLFVADLSTGHEARLTRDGSENVINGTFDWVHEEELDLRDGWRWSPDGRRIAFWRLDQSGVRTFTWLNDTDSVYSRPIQLRYPKAGTANATSRIGVVDVASGSTTWMETGSDPEAYLARMEWAASPEELVIQRLNRHQNRLDVLLADASTGRSRALFSETDSAWVDVDDDLIWIDGGRRFLWSSERDGWNHLYLYNRDGSVARQLTRGAWEVASVDRVDERAGRVYFTGTAEGPTQRHLYQVGLNGREMRRIGDEPGTHRVTLAPGSPYYVDVHSRAGLPPVTTLRSIRDGSVVRGLVDNTAMGRALEGLAVRRPEFFSFRTTDGTELNGWMIKPADFDPERKYPVLMYVYGGPGSQTVTDAWGGTRYLWHQHLAQNGYIVVSVDGRGTGARGRAFRKGTYLNLGEIEARDQIEGARYLATLPFVDPDRLGIWGWSYGGYMTALTMMTEGSPFRAGISVAPVTDWKLYDTIYTERFMRTPQENPEGYRRSAPVQRAADLRGDLLLIHGTADDNVHFQNAVQLAGALQAAGKQFDFMLYPDRNHSISGGGTSLHLFTLMTDWVKERL